MKISNYDVMPGQIIAFESKLKIMQLFTTVVDVAVFKKTHHNSCGCGGADGRAF